MEDTITLVGHNIQFDKLKAPNAKFGSKKPKNAHKKVHKNFEKCFFCQNSKYSQKSVYHFRIFSFLYTNMTLSSDDTIV